MTKLLIALLILLTFGCTQDLDNKINQDTITIVNLALDRTIGAGKKWRRLKLPLLPKGPIVKVGSLKYTQFLKWRDSLKAVLDTAKLFVVVNKEVDVISLSDVENNNYPLQSKDNIQNNMNGDSSFIEVLKELYNSRKSYDSIQIEDLVTKFNYQLYSDKLYPNDNLKKVGLISFSKVAYNHKKNRAAIHTNFVCGNLCGGGQIILFELKNNVWTCVTNWSTCIS